MNQKVSNPALCPLWFLQVLFLFPGQIWRLVSGIRPSHHASLFIPLYLWLFSELTPQEAHPCENSILTLLHIWAYSLDKRKGKSKDLVCSRLCPMGVKWHQLQAPSAAQRAHCGSWSWSCTLPVAGSIRHMLPAEFLYSLWARIFPLERKRDWIGMTDRSGLKGQIAFSCSKNCLSSPSWRRAQVFIYYWACLKRHLGKSTKRQICNYDVSPRRAVLL